MLYSNVHISYINGNVHTHSFSILHRLNMSARHHVIHLRRHHVIHVCRHRVMRVTFINQYEDNRLQYPCLQFILPEEILSNCINIVQNSISEHFFTLRTISVWNSLPNDIICCTSVNSFAKRLKSINILHFLTGHTSQWCFTCNFLFLQYAKII